LKKIYDWACQKCATRIESPSGPYAEAAHIKPLGRPDDGPDIGANMLCLCPNHHKLLDSGGVVVDENWKVIHIVGHKDIGALTRDHRHGLTQEYLQWHRERWLRI
jgi:putative restriction endonuclease